MANVWGEPAAGPRSSPVTVRASWFRRWVLGAELRTWPSILLYEVVIVNLVVFAVAADMHPWLRATNVVVAVVAQLWNGHHAWRRIAAALR